MIIVFVIDTSASMNQRSTNGLTLLDCAKSAVEHFLKVRSRDNVMRSDKYFLVTCEEGSSGIKSGWKENFATFTQELKNLTARDLSNIGGSLKRTFDLLNFYRLQTTIDNYGQGRNPWFIEPSIIILLTDGSALTNQSGVLNTLTLPLTPNPGSELNIEPFRWDQRLFTYVLHFNGVNTPSQRFPGPVATPDSYMGPMSDVTGGKCQVITSLKMLLQAIENLVPKLQTGVVVSFDNLERDKENRERERDKERDSSSSVNGGELSPVPPCSHKLLLIPPNCVGYWPIPEAFLPDNAMTQLAPRTAHPTIYYSTVDSEPPSFVKSFPCDSYEIEPCALTTYLLSHKKEICWQTFIMNSNGPNSCEPFGYLKIAPNGKTVNLFVLPYNYPKFWPLLEELVNVFKLNPTPKWRQEFESYLTSIPCYYINPFRNAMKRLGIANAVPDHLDGGLNYTLSSYLKKLKQQSKAETDRLQAALKQSKSEGAHSGPTPVPMQAPVKAKQTGAPRLFPSGYSSRNYHQLLDRGSTSEGGNGVYEVPMPENIASDSHDPMAVETTELSEGGHHQDEIIGTGGGGVGNEVFRNVFNIPRGTLLHQIDKLRARLFSLDNTEEEENKHSVPISQMGNYTDALLRRELLRDLDDDEDRRARAPLFGNPYRIEKSERIQVGSIDEADEATPGQNAARKSFKRRLQSGRSHPNKIARPSPPPSPSTGSGVSSNGNSSSVGYAQTQTQTQTQTTQTTQTQTVSQIQGHVESNQSLSLQQQVGPVIGQDLTKLELMTGSPISTNHTSRVGAISLAYDNRQLKQMLSKELRKPSKDYRVIFLLLNQVQGNLEKRAIIDELVKQASMFKKTKLINELTTYRATVEA